MNKKIYFITQAKGGAGKSVLAYYHLRLSETILTMIGLDTEDDSIHDLYFQLTQQSESLDLSNIGTREQQLNKMAQSIYSELSRRKALNNPVE